MTEDETRTISIVRRGYSFHVWSAQKQLRIAAGSLDAASKSPTRETRDAQLTNAAEMARQALRNIQLATYGISSGEPQ